MHIEAQVIEALRLVDAYNSMGYRKNRNHTSTLVNFVVADFPGTHAPSRSILSFLPPHANTTGLARAGNTATASNSINDDSIGILCAAAAAAAAAVENI
jgi:hypothetical protein